MGINGSCIWELPEKDVKRTQPIFISIGNYSTPSNKAHEQKKKQTYKQKKDPETKAQGLKKNPHLPLSCNS